MKLKYFLNEVMNGESEDENNNTTRDKMLKLRLAHLTRLFKSALETLTEHLTKFHELLNKF